MKSPSQMDSVIEFVDALAALKFPNVFNPYADRCERHDLPDAVAIRKKNLELVLNASIVSGVESMWIGRDLGYRGGRRTGLALTDEMHLIDHARMLGLEALRRSTSGPAFGERTANITWSVLNSLRRPVFLWNIFPLHPFVFGDAMSNRTHTKYEADCCRFLLSWLIQALRPRRLIAIGRDAQNTLQKLDLDALPVRHPSYGGQSEFIQSMSTYYDLALSEDRFPSQISLFN